MTQTAWQGRRRRVVNVNVSVNVEVDVDLQFEKAIKSLCRLADLRN